jgi:hypothetical protein
LTHIKVWREGTLSASAQQARVRDRVTIILGRALINRFWNGLRSLR